MRLQAYQLQNQQGLTLTVLNYGAIIQSLTTAKGEELVLGYDDAAQYVAGNPCYLGAVIGPLANRVSQASFSVDKQHYQLEPNENQQHCLHSGQHGLHQVFWQVSEINNGLLLEYHAADGEAGFPGPADYEIRYTLNDENQLILDYRATVTQATAIDLTNHTYWHLGGDVLDTHACFQADQYLAVDKNMIPTGARLAVAETPLDFRAPKLIGTDLAQLTSTHGYDHYFIVAENHELKPMAELFSPATGIHLSVSSTAPGFQFYTGNFLPQPYQGFCVETQGFPNAINQADFPQPLVTPEAPYRQRTIYQLSFD